MTLAEARHILGLEPDDELRPQLRALGLVRERIAEMVRNEADESMAVRYQQGLMDFDRALAAIREDLESDHPTGPVAPDEGPAAAIPDPGPPPARPERVSGAVATRDPATPTAAAGKSPRRRHATAFFIWLFIILLGAAAVGWYYYAKMQEAARLEMLSRITRLERAGAADVETRRWREAAAAYDEIERLAPASQVVARGRRSIDAGLAEEHQQFAGYWTGQAQAALDAERWDEAESAARQVLEKFPDDKPTAKLLETIAVAHTAAAHRAALAAAQDLLTHRQWDAAIHAVEALLGSQPQDPDAEALLAAATGAKAQAATELIQARDLFKRAAARDEGQFDQQALDWLHEASILAPEDAEIAAQLEKMAAYTRTLRVPRDFPTPAEALANARDRDRIILNEGTWKGPLSVNVAIELQGAGTDKTRIECPADAGCAITLGPGASGARLSGITFRHESQTAAAERFSAGLIRGAAVALVDCQFIDACGHGLAVIEGGKADVARCRFAANGWDGVAAMGAGSVLEIRDSKANSNFEHGIESWGGAAVVLVNNRCEANSRNGIHADNPKSAVTVEGNQLIDNREFGLVLDAAGSGQVRKNTASGNLLGGFVIRAASRVPVTGNQLNHNQGPGLSLEKGIDASAFADNALSGNADKQLLTDVTFPPVTTQPVPAAAQPATPAAQPATPATAATPPPRPPAAGTPVKPAARKSIH